jgi:hypothetical protein
MKGQSIYKTFGSQMNQFTLYYTGTKLKHNPKTHYLISPVSMGISGGYKYIFPLKNYFGIGIGLEIGYFQYKLQPIDNNFNMDYTKSKVITVRLPVFINKYYPLNNKLALNFKSGISINTLLSSLASFGEMTINNRKLYDTETSINSVPQGAILFEIGVSTRINKQNLLTLNAIISHNFIKKIEATYNYYSKDNKKFISRNLYSTGSFAGIAISYSFNSQQK